MSLLKEQQQAAPYRGLPIEEKNDSSSITSVTGETAAFYYSNSGTRTADAGQAAGVAVEAVFAYTNIKNSSGKMQGSKLDTSLSFTSTAFTTEVFMATDVFERFDDVSWANRLSGLTAGLANGEYVVDYAKGIAYGKKASTQTSLTSTAYKVNSEVLGSVSIVTTGLAASMTDDAAYTPGTSLTNPSGFTADETGTDSVDEGDIGTARMTLDRRQITASESNDDAAPSTGTKPSMQGFVFDDVAPDSVDEGDLGYGRMSANRNQYVTIRDAAGNERGLNIDSTGALGVGSVVPGTAATNLGKAEDAAHTSGDTGVMALGVSNAAQATFGADGDYTPLATDIKGNPSVVGNLAHDAADAGNPVKVGAVATNVEPAAVSATGDRTQLIADMVGKLITLPYANPENFVSGAITSAMTGTTSTSLISAPAGSLRNYITQITVSNSHATVGTDIIIQDGSGGTTLYVIPAAANYGGATITFPVPLRQPTAATALYCANVTTGSSTKVSASGYKGL